MNALTGAGSVLPNGSNILAAQSSPRFAHPSFPLAWLASIAQLADVLLMLTSGWLASQICKMVGIGGDGGGRVLATALATLSTLVVLRQLGAYRRACLLYLSARLVPLVIGASAGTFTALLCLGTSPEIGGTALMWPAIWGVFALSLCVIAAACGARACGRLQTSGALSRRVAVVGMTSVAQAFIDRTRDKAFELDVVGLYHDGDEATQPVAGLMPRGHFSDLVTRSRQERIDVIVLAYPLSDVDRITRICAILGRVTADIYVATDFVAPTLRAKRSGCIGGQPVIQVVARPLDDVQMLQKTVFDRCLAAVLVVIALPVLGLIALAIRLDSPGPVLFRQPRDGLNGAMFSVFKFRTMFHHLADLKADRQTTRGDARITRVGRLLRRFSLDEVPQLLNVLRGEMSLVGPRPHAPNTKAGDVLFHEAVADYALRHRVKPGITGWAQVNGWRGETRTQQQIEQRVAHDLHYIDHWSLILDLRILALTLIREINSRVVF